MVERTDYAEEEEKDAVSYGTFAIDILRSDLGFFRDIDGAWVVVYQGVNVTGPLYLRLAPERNHTNGEPGWVAGGIDNCTLFESYEGACSTVRQISYMASPLSLARVVKLKIKVDIHIDLLEDRPVNILDALAEV